MSGALMGIARDSFGSGGPEGGAVAVLSGTLAGPESGMGAAVSAFDTESGVVGEHVATLGEHDRAAGHDLLDAVAASAAGRGRVDAVIGSARIDVDALGPLTDTPEGRRALVDALTRRLDETRGVLDDGAADAATRAAAASVSAAGYDGLGRFPAGGPVQAPMGVPALPTLPASSPVPLAGVAPALSSLAQLVSYGNFPQSRNPVDPALPDVRRVSGSESGFSGNGAVDSVLRRALAQRGLPYSYGGGSASGPSRGDDGDVGFDCSSLMQYAYAGAGVDLPRTTYDQINLGQQVPRHAIRAGDLIFSNFDSRGPGHVQLAISPTHTVEAPSRDGHVQISAVPVGRIVVKRILS